ncbi:MAG: hypothetical protein K8S27_15970 [Candidatus Omnitrophica bacterium]|nr:hypothetical protein [Candidatus Omnitrophota bacterium]
MKLTISSLYLEQGCEFSISFKVRKLIRQKLEEHVMQPYHFDEKDKDLFLGLIISTNSTTKRVEVKGPDFDKRNKVINWGLWLPYELIVKNEEQLVPYINYLFDALVIVFEFYNIEEDVIRNIQKIVANEVIDNPKYDIL